MAHTERTTPPHRRSRLPARLRQARAACRARRASAPRPPTRYDRRTDLPRVLPLWPHEIDDDTLQGRERVLAKLASALRAERRRGIAGHWTYDLARHAELLRVYRHELALMRDPHLQ